MSSHNHDEDDSDDTDWDSMYDERPADGTYQPRPSSPSSAKAQEAANERSVNTNLQESSSQPQQSSQSGAPWVDETTPLLDAGPPPPAYSDIAANRPYPGDNNNNANQEPQSMGGETDIERNEEPTKKNRRGRPRSNFARKFIRSVLLLWVVASIVMLLVNVWPSATKNENNHDGGKDTPDNHDTPDKPDTPNTPDAPDTPDTPNKPDTPKTPNKPDTPKTPDMPGTPDAPDTGTRPQVPPWWTPPRLGDCDFEHYSSDHFFEFTSPKSFSFLELMEDSHIPVREVDGLVRITAGSANQKAAIVVGVSFATTAEYQVTQVNMKQTGNSLSLNAPFMESTASGSSKRSCMNVHATIFIRPDIKLEDLEVATDHLHLHVQGGLFDRDNKLAVGNTEFTTIRGDVDVVYWSSRNTVIEVISGSVSGTYALRDLLSIKTSSGTINVDVEPRPIDRSSPAPAQFTAKTISGSIKTHFLTDDLPEREYRTHVESSSGNLSGFYILGSTSTFKTISGTISADILPYAADDGASTLRTDTSSGTTNIKLLSPFLNPGHPMTRLRSTHHTTSSSLNLVYPQEWEGTAAGGTMSGSLAIHGRDVEVVEVSRGPVGKRIRVRKGSGNGSSNMEFGTTSGNVRMTLGIS